MRCCTSATSTTEALAHFPSGRCVANAAWTILAALAHNLLCWTTLIGLPASTVRTARTSKAERQEAELKGRIRSWAGVTRPNVVAIERLRPDRYGELVAFLSCSYEVVLVDRGAGRRRAGGAVRARACGQGRARLDRGLDGGGVDPERAARPAHDLVAAGVEHRRELGVVWDRDAPRRVKAPVDRAARLVEERARRGNPVAIKRLGLAAEQLV